MNYWPELVELYEYKVADLRAGGRPRGGVRAVAELRNTLLAADLPAPLLRRLRLADQHYRAWRSRPGTLPEQDSTVKALVQPEAQPEQNPSIVAGTREASPATPGFSAPGASAQAWYDLQVMAWSASSSVELARRMQDLRHEPQRPTLRVLYAVIENAERRLRAIHEPFSVPAPFDPLVSLQDKEVVRSLTDSLSELLLHPEGRQALLGSLAYVRDHPFAPHPDDEPLRQRLEIVQHTPMNSQQRERLMAEVQAQYPQAHDPRERPVLREAVNLLAQILQGVLAQLPSPDPAAPVLFAPELNHDPVAAQQAEARAAQSSELTIYLGGPPQEFSWRGHHLRWQAAGKNWQLQLDKALLMLYPHLSRRERSVTLPDGAEIWQLYYSGPYVLLRLHTTHYPELAQLSTQARAVALLMDPSGQYANLRLARAAEQALRGRPLNLPALSPDSAVNFRKASAEDLQQFVQQGLATLEHRIRSVEPAQAEKVLRECAAALGIAAERPQLLHAALHASLHNPDTLPSPIKVIAGQRTVLPPGGHFQTFQLAGGPLELLVRGRVVTLRPDYKGDLSVLVAGMSPQRLDRILVIRLGEQTLLLARHDDLLAVASEPDRFEDGELTAPERAPGGF